MKSSFHFGFLAVVVVVSGCPQYDAAMDSIFALQSGVTPVSGHVAARRALSNMMRRQSIPQEISDLRSLSDADLFRLAQLASIGGVSRWKRNTSNDLILLTDNGQMIHPYSPGAVESDVMLCVICALLTVIAIHHYTPLP
jgi:hypothetical protein